METQTVYAKLKKAESFFQQIPEGFRTLYKIQVLHTENDLVGIRWYDDKDSRNFCFISVDRLKEIRVKESWIDIDSVTGSSITLYKGPSQMSHTNF